MHKFLTPATAIALVLGLQGCGTVPTFPKLNVAGTSAPTKHSEAKGHMNEQIAIAEAAQVAGDSASSVRILRNLAREYPLSIRPRIKLGDALLAANAPQEAARAYQGANNVKKTLEGLVGLGRVELALRKPADALRHFDEAAEIKAEDAQVLNGRAVALDQLGRHQEAQQIYLTILEKEPSNIKIRNNYALSLGLAGNYDDAADILSSLAQVPDSEARIRQNLALVYGLQGNDGQAAHLGRIDLDEDAVNNNLKYYQAIRNLDSPSAKTAELTHPTAHGPVGPEVSHYSAADAGEPAGELAAEPSAPASPTYVDAPRAEAAPAKSPRLATMEVRNIEATQVRSASEPRLGASSTDLATKNGAPTESVRAEPVKGEARAKPASAAKTHKGSVASLPMTRAEAAAQQAAASDGKAKASDTRPEPIAGVLGAPADAPAKVTRGADAVPAAETAAMSDAKPGPRVEETEARARQPAVPPFKENAATTNVTAATKKIEQQPGVEVPPDAQAGAKSAKASPVKIANARAKPSETSGTPEPKGVEALDGNPVDTGVRPPAVPALL